MIGPELEACATDLIHYVTSFIFGWILTHFLSLFSAACWEFGHLGIATPRNSEKVLSTLCLRGKLAVAAATSFFMKPLQLSCFFNVHLMEPQNIIFWFLTLDPCRGKLFCRCLVWWFSSKPMSESRYVEIWVKYCYGQMTRNWRIENRFIICQWTKHCVKRKWNISFTEE